MSESASILQALYVIDLIKSSKTQTATTCNHYLLSINVDVHLLMDIHIYIYNISVMSSLWIRKLALLNVLLCDSR